MNRRHAAARRGPNHRVGLILFVAALLACFTAPTRGQENCSPKGRELFQRPIVIGWECGEDGLCPDGFKCERVEYRAPDVLTMRCAYLPDFVFPEGTPPVPFE